MDEARRPAAQMRSLAIYQDLIILNTVDAHVVGLDARTGEVRWETPVVPGARGLRLLEWSGRGQRDDRGRSAWVRALP